MKKDFHNDVNKENLDIAGKILLDSQQMNDINVSKPNLEDVLKDYRMSSKQDSKEATKNDTTSSKYKWKKRYTYAIGSAIAACLILAIGLNFLPENLFNRAENIPISSTINLRNAAFASDYSEIYDKLISANTTIYDYYNTYAIAEYAALDSSDGMPKGSSNNSNRTPEYSGQAVAKENSASTSSIGNDSGSTENNQDFYDTNEQTANVHEGDIVKTDGKYIYTLRYSNKNNCYQLIITKADGIKMNIVKKIILKPEPTTNTESDSENTDKENQKIESSAAPNTSVNIQELYIYNNRLVVIGTQYDYSYYDGFCHETSDCIYPYGSSSVTYIYVYDISEPENAVLIDKLSQDGGYVSSRMKNNYLYTVTTHTMIHPTEDVCVPKVNGKLVTPDSVYLPEQTEGNDFTVITGLDVTDSKDFTTSKSVLGGSSNLYASQDYIYVINAIYDEDDISDTNAGKKALKKFNATIYDNEKFVLTGNYKKLVKQYIKDYNLDIQLKDITAYKDTGAYKTTTRTDIIKFTYDEGNVSFIADNKIDGHTEDNLNFDEKDGYLRCVTTENSSIDVNTVIKCYDKDGKFLFNITKHSEFISSTQDTNNVFVLDDKLNITAELNNLARGESIYSARYLGDYGYFVTYEKTDPLFSVDFSDMKNPRIIGELKMPGYSEYLHFYGENKLFGFGLEESSGTASEQLKLEMYNVKDGKAEKETKTLLEDYSYSESMYNYKSIMIDPEKNLIGFTAEEESYTSDFDYRWHQYYVVYSYKNNAFKELYKIKINKYAYEVRGFYIGNYLYVVAPEYGIYAINMETYNNDKKVEYVTFR